MVYILYRHSDQVFTKEDYDDQELILLVVGIMMAALFAGCGNDAPNAQKEQASKKIQW